MSDDTKPESLIAVLAPLCKQHGIKRVRVGEVELEFGSSETDKNAIEEFRKTMQQGGMTDEQVLFWSVGDAPPKEQ